MRKLILFLSLCFPLFSSAQTWQSVYQQADSLLQKRNFKESIPFYEQALPLAEKEYGKEHENYLKTRNGLGRSIMYVKTKEEIEPFLLENVALCKKHGEKTAVYAQALHNAGTFYYPQFIGNSPQKCEEFLKQALVLRKEILGEKHPDYAGSLNNLANFYADMGNYPAAEPLLKQALVLRKETVGEKHSTYATSLNNLAGLYWNMGNYPAAEPLLKQALQIQKEILGEKHPDYAVSLNNLANLYNEMGNYPAAEPLLKQALQIQKEILGEKHPEYAISLHSAAELYRNMNRYALADSFAQQNFDIRKQNEMIDFWDYNALGTIQTARKDYAAAEQNLLKGSELLAKIQGKGSLNYLYNQHDLALVYWASGQQEKATPLFAEIKNSAVDITLKQFSNLSEREREAFFDNKIRRYVQDFSSFVASTSQNLQGLKDLTGLKPLIGEMYNFQLFSKAILLNAAAKWKHNILGSSDKRLINKFFEWEAIRNRLTAMYQEEEVDLTLVDSLENQANEMEKQLSKLSERFNKISDKKIRTWQEIQTKLQVGEAAIEMVRIQKFGVYKTVTDSSDKKLPKYDLKYLTDTIQYAALIITKNSTEPQLVLMENGNAMEKQLKVYRNSIKFKLEDNKSYNVLWKPIAEALKKEKVSKVYFSPDGLYHQVNLNTLYNPATKKYLADEINLHQLTNTKDLLQEKEEEITNQYAVLLGNPEFDLHVPKLLGTQKEVENIGENLKKNEWETEIKQGREAHEKIIKDLFRPKVLHIATHGYFEARHQETAEEYARPKDAKQAVKSNPLWRSGLLLSKTANPAGVENTSSLSEYDKNDDGILTAYEAMNLNLDGTDLVVLSACETGLGEIKYGEGVYGLQRAFKVAGAKNVVMSLWKVDDAITQELMHIFYETFTKTAQARESFLYAQKQIRDKYKNPYYWGAFVMVE